MLAKRAAHLIKGYSTATTGLSMARARSCLQPILTAEAANILKREDVAYVHVRSSVNNCYTCRIERA